MNNIIAGNLFSQLGAELGKPDGYDYAGAFDPLLSSYEKILEKSAEALNGSAEARLDAAKETLIYSDPV